MRWSLVVVGSAACLLAASGWAAAAEPNLGERPLSAFGGGVSVLAGLGTPLGLVGVEGDLDLLPWLAVRAGAGVSIDGPQLAAMAQLRWPIVNGSGDALAVVAGYGLSRGRYHEHLCIFESCDPEWEGTLWWHNVEAGVEFLARSAAGRLWRLRAFGGVAIAGNPHDLRCLDCVSHDRVDSRWWPFGGVAVGWAFR